MFCICQRNAESMTKQCHTLYGHAVRPEKVSRTTVPRLVVFLFNNLPLARSSLGHNLTPSLPISPTFFSLSLARTTTLGDLQWRLGKSTRGGERWLCVLPVSLSFCSYLLHCCSQLSEFIYTSDLKIDLIVFQFSQVSCSRRPCVQPNGK